MFKYLLPVWILLCLCLPLRAVQAAHEAQQIAAAIASEIQTGEPIILDLRTGEWTAALSQNLYDLLLKKGADLRTEALDELDSNQMLTDEPEEYNSPRLSDYGIDSAILVQVNLNVKWQDVVQKNFFSYRSERQPVYSFETRQIQLPEQRLLKISAYDFVRPKSPETVASRMQF
ncbi:MAG: hypothetical protein PHO32_08950, partial [Candidatus Cloacimonetes bacterium]|nr:hypothetical protein [Candidatus Cloacimonadota bacterium]